mgnify:CR=1 FL=1|tara:strand:+ start:6510 stop:7832 length:1323 start_codon:yes stop_codon:yes gene_type:complete
MSYAEEVIKQSIQDVKLNKSIARRKSVEKLLNYYTGTDTSKYIAGNESNYFDSQSFNEVPPYGMNLTKKFVDKKSRIYTLSPNRDLGNATANKEYSNLLEYKDLRMKHIERMTNLVGTPAVRVMWVEKEDGEVCFDYRVVYYYDAFFTPPSPYKPTSITYPILNPTSDVTYDQPTDFAYWDANEHIIFDEDGNIIEQYANPYGMLPFIFPRDLEQIDDFYGEGSSDVVNVNEHVNILMTELMLGLRFQMFGQSWASGVYEDQPIARVGSDKLINLPAEGRFGIESPGGDPQKVLEIAKGMIEMLAVSKHMYVTFDSNQDRPSSGLALRIKDFEFVEDYKDNIENWRNIEKDLYRLERRIAEVNGVTLPNTFSIDFKEPEYPRAISEQIQKDDWELSHGLITLEEILKRNNSDLSLEDARKIIENNKKLADPVEVDVEQNG